MNSFNELKLDSQFIRICFRTKKSLIFVSINSFFWSFSVLGGRLEHTVNVLCSCKLLKHVSHRLSVLQDNFLVDVLHCVARLVIAGVMSYVVDSSELSKLVFYSLLAFILKLKRLEGYLISSFYSSCTSGNSSNRDTGVQAEMKKNEPDIKSKKKREITKADSQNLR